MTLQFVSMYVSMADIPIKPYSQIMLNNTKLKALKPKSKQYAMADGGSLYIVVKPSGKKVWWLRYRYAGKEKTWTIGEYPAISLAAARKQRDRGKAWLAENKDPSTEARKERQAITGTTFKILATQWMETKRDWSPGVAKDKKSRFDNHIFPFIGDKIINDINKEDLVRIINRLVDRKLHSKTIGKIFGQIINVYNFSIAKGLADRNIASDLKSTLPTGDEETQRKALSKEDIPVFLNKLDAYGGRFETVVALKLLTLTGARPGEVRTALWAEFDLTNGLWSRELRRMKMKRPHVFILSRQVIELLTDLKKVNGHKKQLFPGMVNPDGFISENTLTQAIKKRMGFDATAHGMRAVFSTHANEMGFNIDAIETQLSHKSGDKVRAAYNRAQYLDERRKMMQAWADYLDGLKRGADVIPIKRA